MTDYELSPNNRTKKKVEIILHSIPENIAIRHANIHNMIYLSIIYNCTYIHHTLVRDF